MKVAVIKKLVENHTLEELQAAEEALAEEQEPAIEVEGEDLGDKLTNAYAAVWVKEKTASGETDVRTAIREFSVKVRKSIG